MNYGFYNKKSLLLKKKKNIDIKYLIVTLLSISPAKLTGIAMINKNNRNKISLFPLINYFTSST